MKLNWIPSNTELPSMNGNGEPARMPALPPPPQTIFLDRDNLVPRPTPPLAQNDNLENNHEVD
ncbi:MAG: hypothetical protein GX901_03400 [Lentisphaerae bacterium]|nr:hypothetical protein [Lentisphaerota bacterium]